MYSVLYLKTHGQTHGRAGCLLLLFPPKSFIVLCFTLRSGIHFEVCVEVYSLAYGYTVLAPWVEKTPFSVELLLLLCHKSNGCVCGGLLLGSLLCVIHPSIYHFMSVTCLEIRQ